ncbi:regulator of microtubule dynamics protein 2 [Zonotrichia leucophrys gambelii]|uniref:Regulator of microtubule dynamics protein 2 n=2 Tax=Zonotrichia albicollis TaxID=44394 RepID=A0A8D2NAU0_ZONAL|nr:regulator of microtubule dynamics protein 2 [Zonotrichia albicollis]XP_014122167.1 regulator of microtubule dynamics protein 2 [Zonotrichia albicollis]XP_014122168.1 regulator of microtubule dynamics protein 2 [Zonotrichia albicollis]XP_026648885.1 regulator of microtubule dynamics protein 2 [Zonotrichia albicollis]
MSPFENRGLMLGIMAGTAGLSLVLVCYRKIRKPGAAVRIRGFQDIGNRINSVVLPQNEAPNEQGAVMVLHGRQLQILEKLNGLLLTVDELKREVEFLKEAIPKLEELVRKELQGSGDVQRVSPSHRATRRRKAETAPRETTSSEEAESEGGYLTAHTDSEGESEEEKRWTKSPDAVVESEKDEDLHNFLQQVDNLHKGSEADKKEGFRLLLENDDKYENCVDFLWRLARAYGDLFEMTTDAEEKRKYVTDGKIKAEKAIQLDAGSAESHQWFAIMCGYMSQFESVQNKIRNGYLFKEHLDKAIELKPQDPFLYYLNGRWCYSVAQLSWLEKKVAAALFETPPTSTVEEALQNFLKAEEMHPGYSKCNYVYLAKCYKDLGQKSNALKYCDSALSILSVTNEDKEAQKDLEALLLTLKL